MSVPPIQNRLSEGTMWMLPEMLGEEPHRTSGKAFVKPTGEQEFVCSKIRETCPHYWLEAAMRFAKAAPLGERIAIDHARTNELGRKAILQVCGERTYLCGFTEVETVMSYRAPPAAPP